MNKPSDTIYQNKLFDKLTLKHIIILSIVLRLLFAFLIYQHNNYDTKCFWAIHGDTGGYVNSAENLLKYGSFSIGEYPNLIPFIHRTPGYPVFLIPGLIIGSLEWYTIIVQILLSSLIILFIYKIGKTIIRNENVILLACLFYSLSIQSIRYTNYILTETLFSFLLVISTYLFLKYLRFNRFKFAFLSFVILIISIYVRPIGYFFYPLLFIIFVISQFRRKVEIRTIVLSSIIIFLIGFIGIGIWQYRNYKKTGYKGFSQISVENLYSYFAPKILAEKEGINIDKVYKRLGISKYHKHYFLVHPEQKNWKISEILDYQEEFGKNVILNNFWIFTKLQIIGTLRTFVASSYPKRLLTNLQWKQKKQSLSTKYSSNIFSKFLNLGWPIWIKFSMYLFNTLVFIIFIYSIVRFKYKNQNYWFLILTIFYFIVIGGFHGLERFRLPILSFYLLFVANGIYMIFESLKRRVHKFQEISERTDFSQQIENKKCLIDSDALR